MKLLTQNTVRGLCVATLGLFAGLAQAHTGHGTSGIAEGLAHPLGADHLLAMVAVGLWSVTALPAHKAWWGPATFMLSLVVSAALGAAGFSVPFLEPMVSLSVVLFGAMLVLRDAEMPNIPFLAALAGALRRCYSLVWHSHTALAAPSTASAPALAINGTLAIPASLSRQKMPVALGLGLVALAASVHGLAHGAETPETGFAVYAAGFLASTAALHFGGLAIGSGIRKAFAEKSTWVVTGLGTLCGGAGLYLFSQA